MAYVQRVRRPAWRRNRGEVVEERRVGDDVVVQDSPVLDIITRIIWLAAGIILLILAFRFILSLLGANTSNGFANFIYDISHPFVAPFFGLFNYDNINYGVSRFEIYTLVAMAVYAAVAWVLTAVVNIGRR